MSNRRTSSFRLAVENEGRVPLVPIDHYQYPYNPNQQPVPNTLFRAMVKRIAREFLTDDLDRQYYADNYACCPPPLFVPIITFVEVFFVHIFLVIDVQYQRLNLLKYSEEKLSRF
jgi:rhomboid-related protein 1/2/3